MAKSNQTKKLLNTLHERQQRYCMSPLFRKPPVHHDQSFIASSSKDHSHKAQTNTGRDIGPPSEQSEAFLIIDDDDDDCQPTAAKSTLATKSPAAIKGKHFYYYHHT